MEADLFFQGNNELGEGPVWDSVRKELLWVDIEKQLLHFFSIQKELHSQYQIKGKVGCALPVRNSELYLLALQDGLAYFNRKDQSYEYISDCESGQLLNRFNDGKCDSQGRFWVGSMNLNGNTGEGALYTLENTLSINKKISDLTIPNGMDWSADDKSMYFIDTAKRSVYEYEFNSETGAIFLRDICIHVPEELGYPDGMCIDKAGMLWIAIWGGACISRWNPQTGLLLESIDVPAKNVSSLCFGNENNDTLFITSARLGLNDQELEKYPLSGSVFSFKPEVHGNQANFFVSQKITDN